MNDLAKRVHEITLSCLKKLLEDEYFNNTIKCEYEAKELPKLKVVSLSEDLTLRVLVYGQCPCCRALHMRNICNVRFINHCIVPLLKEKVSTLRDVKCVLTHDDDLDGIVQSLGGRVKIIKSKDEVMTFYEHECFLLRQHPDIDGYSKFMTLRDESIPDVKTKNELIRFGDVIERYYCSWSISDGHGVLLTKDGKVIAGKDIMRQSDDWMSRFSLGKMKTWNDLVLSLMDADAIKHTDYKQVEFE